MTTDSTTNKMTAGSLEGPAVVVAADPLAPSFRALLEENRRLRRECSRLWIKLHGDRERQELILDRLDRVAELEAADERGDLDDYMTRVLATFDASLNDTRKPADDYTIPRAA